MLRIEWSARKNRGNILKHGVDFEEAKSVFDDPMQLTESDPDHSIEEKRFITIGMSDRNRLLIMAHTIEDDRIRIIRHGDRHVRNEKIMKKEGSMRKEYDLSRGKRGLLFGKVDTANVTALEDDAAIDEAIDSELHVLESNLVRIESLRPRLSDLDPATKKALAKRLADAKAKLDEMAIPE